MNGIGFKTFNDFIKAFKNLDENGESFFEQQSKFPVLVYIQTPAANESIEYHLLKFYR